MCEAADVKLRLYSIEGSEAKLAAETQVPYQTVSKVQQESALHRHADGTAHVHGDDSLVRGLDLKPFSERARHYAESRASVDKSSTSSTCAVGAVTRA